MQYNNIAQSGYEKARYNKTKLVETKLNNVDLNIYDDGTGLNTIGIGMTLEESSGKVHAAVVEVIAKDFSPAVVLKLNTIINDGKSLSAAALQSALDKEMKTYSDANPTLNLRKSFAFASETQVETAFKTISVTYENEIDKQLPSVPRYSQERLAYFSLSYNSLSLIGGGLKAAVAAGDRADAWYEIRYNSNGGTNVDVKNGIAKRRFYESEVHQLYRDPSNPTVEEAKQVGEMYATHRDSKILGYEKTYAAQLSAGYNAGFAHDIYFHLQPAIKTLKATYGIASGTVIEEVLMASGTTINLKGDHLGTDTVGSITNGADTIFDNSQNDQDLLIGNEAASNLNGMKGGDILFGALGNDTLMGSAGSDTLHGGTTSTKAIDITDGIDTANYLSLPTTVQVKVTYTEAKWILDKVDSAGVYTGSDELRSIEVIMGNNKTIFDIHKSATPVAGTQLTGVILDGGANGAMAWECARYFWQAGATMAHVFDGHANDNYVRCRLLVA